MMRGGGGTFKYMHNHDTAYSILALSVTELTIIRDLNALCPEQLLPELQKPV